MRKIIVSLVTIGSFMLLAPLALMAQNDPPPPPPGCCPRGTEVAGQSQAGAPVAKGQLLISTGMLQAQGITKREFAERLSMSIFAGKAVDLVLSVTTTSNRPGLTGAVMAPVSQALVAVQETRFYRVPLYSLDAQQLEALNQFGLTDGTVQIMVKFIKSESIESDTL